MAKIGYCVFCDEILPVPHQSDKFQLVSPVMFLAPIAIPSNYSFSLSFGIKDIDLRNQGNSVKVVVLSHDGENLYDSGDFPLSIEANMSQGMKPSQYMGVNCNINFRNIAIKKEGLHRANIYFCGELLHTAEIEVLGENCDTSI